MNKTLILGLAAAGLIFGSLASFAGSDEKYPAFDFQPKVIYADEEMIAASVKSSPATTVKQSSEIDPDYPAYNFQPKVIFGGEDTVASTAETGSTAKKVAEFDPKYPAANFQPKVIYP